MSPRLLLLVRVCTLLYAAFILLVTLRPSLDHTGVDGLGRQIVAWLQAAGGPVWLDYAAVEFIANVGMFFVLGVLVGLSLRPGSAKVTVWAVIGLIALSVAIETVQGVLLPSRVADARDVLSNGLGGALGVGVVALVRRPRRPTMEAVPRERI